MPNKIYVTNPQTKITKSAQEWAKKFQVNESTFRRWVRDYPPEVLFAHNFRENVVRRRWENPKTNECFTSKQWAEILNITTGGFLDRVRKWGLDDPRTFSQNPLIDDLQGVSVFHIVAKRNQSKFCTNPETGESLLACEWAKRYRVPLIEFYQTMKHYEAKYGKDSHQLYQHFERRKVSA
jgi:hypothetical protein